MWKLKGRVIYLGATVAVSVEMGCSHQTKDIAVRQTSKMKQQGFLSKAVYRGFDISTKDSQVQNTADCKSRKRTLL